MSDNVYVSQCRFTADYSKSRQRELPDLLSKILFLVKDVVCKLSVSLADLYIACTFDMDLSSSVPRLVKVCICLIRVCGYFMLVHFDMTTINNKRSYTYTIQAFYGTM